MIRNSPFPVCVQSLSGLFNGNPVFGIESHRPHAELGVNVSEQVPCPPKATAGPDMLVSALLGATTLRHPLGPDFESARVK